MRWPEIADQYSESLRAERVVVRNPVRARCFAPVQTCPAAHPTSYIRGTGAFSGVKRLKCGVGHQHQSSAEVKKYWTVVYSHPMPSWRVIWWNWLLPHPFQ